MKIQNYDEAFPYIIIDDYYDEEELRMIWEELEFLSYPHKMRKTSVEGGAPFENGELVKKNFSRYIDLIYNYRELSNILNVNRKLFADDYRIFRQHPHWFFQNLYINDDFTQVAYYEDDDEYKEHRDYASVTALTWLYKQPKQFTGGDLYIGPEKIKIDCVHNRTFIMPSMIEHSVNQISMNPEHTGQDKRQGRYVISQFGNCAIKM